MRYVLILLGVMFTNVASAIDCEKMPDCASLGYSTEPEPNCAADGYILCPLDHSYKKCVNIDCAKMGFTESDKTSWCNKLIKCQGNPLMTLCQKSCFATDYGSLKDLAESGKCKVVTMLNDIIIPQNQTIRLEANTIIDGGGHTLQSSGNKVFSVYTMYDKSGFKNIFIKHNHSEYQYNFFIFYSPDSSYNMTLHDTQILVQSSDADMSHATPVFLHGTYEISGQFTADIQADGHYVLAWANLIFKDADINVTGKLNGVMGDVDFIDSQGSLAFGTDILSEYTFTFENSQIHLNSEVVSWADSRKFGTILLKDNAELELTFKNLTSTTAPAINKLMHIKFESSASAPATLIMEGTKELASGDVTASNPSDTLVLNGVTYHPKKAGTTLLSEIDKSPDWQKQ